MRDQLEALILQMYKSNILYSEAVRANLKSGSSSPFCRKTTAISAAQRVSWGCIATR